MWFHQLFPSSPYIHKDKHLFLITKQIYLNYHFQIDIHLETFRLILLLILCILFSIHDLHSILLKFPDILSTSSGKEVDINLTLSKNLGLYAIFLLSLHSFLIGTKKSDIFFHIFSNTTVKFTFRFFC